MSDNTYIGLRCKNSTNFDGGRWMFEWWSKTPYETIFDHQLNRCTTQFYTDLVVEWSIFAKDARART
ncbi:hypothetical protein CIK93_07195 [Prevotella sp. P3-92]|nr:hypothetical protein CIK93_07195 [Prevotella sp. P3-92]